MRAWRNWWGLRCWMRACSFEHYETEHGCGGRCPDCGHVVGWVTSDELRAMGDRAIDREREP